LGGAGYLLFFRKLAAHFYFLFGLGELFYKKKGRQNRAVPLVQSGAKE
jgi:hypothetical protein